MDAPQLSTSNLPSGTLTFLFTDIEGSTNIWEHYPEQMRMAMARHDSLIESAVQQQRGQIIRPRGEGDSRFAVFTHASSALRAAVAIQRLIFAEPWSIPPLRVRIALHTGEADLREGDYYGSTVNRCARIRSAAHGGQILLSQITSTLVADALPESVGLRDLGEYKLKHLKRPEHIYQLIINGLPADFPPLRTQESIFSNLPAALTSFIGRAKEMIEVKDILSSVRLLTISGAGGSGKTRLVLQMAADLIVFFPDGLWFVDLTPLSNSELVTQYVMNSMGIREEVCCPPIQTLIDSLRDKTLLLILDNCEHTLQGVAQLTETMLRSTSNLKILTTSREPLGVPGETVWIIPPLSAPKLNNDFTLEKLTQYEAVKLFIERAKAVRSNFVITEGNAQAVAQICARLDGIPLAIELAAARVRVLPVGEIALRLDDRFRLLVSNQNVLPRHKTLRSLIDWSHDLLPENERVLFRRLSVFSGGWTLNAAEKVCSGGSVEPLEVLDLLTHLVDKSLVIMERQAGSARYSFLETIRQYARECLTGSDERQEFASRHAEYYGDLAQESYAEQWGPKQGYWFAKLEAEYDNLRSALDWMAQNADYQEALLRVSGSLWHFWEIRGHISEGRSRLEYALQLAPHASAYLRANGLRGAGILALQQGDYEQAKAMHQESLALFSELDDKLGIGRELDVLGEIEKSKGNYDQAINLLNESLALRYEIGDKEGIAVSLGRLGIIARDRGDYQQAREYLAQSLDLCRQLGDKLLIAQTLNNLGLVEHPLCEYGRAIGLFEEAASLYRELNDKPGLSNALSNLGNVAKDQGDFKNAKVVFNECLTLNQELGDKHGIAQTTVRMAELAFYQGNYPLAIELAEKSSAIFKELGVKRGLNHSLQLQAFVSVYQGDYARALSLGTECLTLSTEVNSPRAFAYSKFILGLCAYAQGDLKASSELLREAWEVFQEYGDRRSAALAAVNLARTAYYQGNHDYAFQILEESVAVSRELEIRWVKSFGLEILGLIQRSEGNYESSFKLLSESLTSSIEQENQQGIANCLGALAGLAVLMKQPDQAVQLFAAAEKIRNTIGVKMGEHDQKEYHRYVAMLQDQLDPREIEIIWSESSTMALEQVIEHVKSWQGTLTPEPR